MKCTRTVTRNGLAGPCGNETNKPVPSIWRKHQHFDDIVRKS